MSLRISRRTVLRGLGASISLPLLDAMAPVANATGADAPPLRLGFVFVPNGVNMVDWKPATTGAKFDLPRILKPLEPVRQNVLILSGLAHDKAQALGDGPGDHARSASVFLTGVHPVKTPGANIRAGVSIDQIAARKLAYKTRFPSLELGCEKGSMAGNCDSGYSCAYSAAISWKSPTQPLPKEINPRSAFDRLFSCDDAELSAEGRAQRVLYRKSILDFVMEDAGKLNQKLGQTDRRKLDEYLTSLREVERRIEDSAQELSPEIRKARPSGVPDDYGALPALMADIIVLSFQTDSTRVASFMYANEGSNRPYPFLGAPEGHHDLSHHQNDAAKKNKIAKINEFQMQQFAYLLQRLAAIPEGEGTILDHSLIVYGSGISDGNRHNHNDLPILVAGKGRGAVKPGRHVEFAKDTPVCNLYLSLLDAVDIHADRFGDSTGRLKGLT